MNLQKKALHRYRQFFPNDTLREVSARTGIQITRVFRLFNGKPMKVGELEVFEGIVLEKLKENPNHLRMSEILEEAVAILTHDEMGRVIEWIERKIIARNYGKTLAHINVEDANIA
jgi:hypothetical protein